MNYLSIAEKIFCWLAQYQVSQKEIDAVQKGKNLCFSMVHPTQGDIEVSLPIPDQSFFRIQGIGFHIEQRHGKFFKLTVYDHGGIFDPLDGYLPGDHYATTHFALLGAILYLDKHDTEILNRVRNGIQFHLRTQKDRYYFGQWGYHADFKNFAFLETYWFLKEFLAEDELNNWRQGFKNWIENDNNPLTNWVAMRSFSSLLRYFLFHKFWEKMQFRWRLYQVERARQKDGCYDDYRNRSRPIQYHIFTLALLHRIYLLHPTRSLKKQLLKGVEYFTRFIDPDGCFNYVGRGQEQIFGYGVGLYILEAAKLLDPSNVDHYESYIKRVWQHIVVFQRDGYFPLVMNPHNDQEKVGWYDYHHLTVYNAFFGCWLGLAHLVRQKTHSRQNHCFQEKHHFIVKLKPSNHVIISGDEYYLVFGGGLPDYLSEPAITPMHLWFKQIGWVFSCPGGPSQEKYGKINQVPDIEKNMLAPIIKIDNSDWIVPAYRSCQRIQAASDHIIMTMHYGPFVLHRMIQCGNQEIIFTDKFNYQENMTIQEFRIFQFPVVIDKFNIRSLENERMVLQSKNGYMEILMGDSDIQSRAFEKLEKIKTAKGLAQIVAKRLHNYQIRKGRHNSLQFILRRTESK